jgi:O-antigen/teichoic acid export membrane protein
MTWNIVIALGSLAATWLSPKIPTFAILIAEKKYIQLDVLLWKLFKIISSVMVFISFSAWGVVYILPMLNLKIASALSSRLLPPLSLGVLLAAHALITISTPFSTYMRAHKKEPLMVISVLSGILVAISTFVFGQKYGAIGVSLGYLGVNSITIPMVFLVWYRFRKEISCDV